jgi:hypothetical protein
MVQAQAMTPITKRAIKALDMDILRGFAQHSVIQYAVVRKVGQAGIPATRP